MTGIKANEKMYNILTFQLPIRVCMDSGEAKERVLLFASSEHLLPSMATLNNLCSTRKEVVCKGSDWRPQR